MANERDITRGAHVISGFRAFVSDDGRPGLRLKCPDGESFDILFSARSIPILRKSLDKLQLIISEKAEKDRLH